MNATVASEQRPQTLGLVLPGGGARAAYQVGVLRALADFLPPKTANPFPIITGTSAGAVNAVYLGIKAHRFRVAVGNLERVWRNFQVEQVFHADTLSMLRSGLHWTLAVLSGGWLLPPPRSLLDNTPLRQLLEENFDFDEIPRSITAGHLRALAISASGYVNARSVSFFDSAPGNQTWTNLRRAGKSTRLTLDHLMASIAVPFLFPPVPMEGEFYGDGSMRQASPFSPAIRLGAERLLVIGTRFESRVASVARPTAPTFGQIFGYMLDALFSDGLYSDLERLTQINRLVEQGGHLKANGHELKKIGLLVLLPSCDLSQIARKHVASLPRTLRSLLRTMGAMNPAGSQLISYLMFQSGFTRELMALGYEDALRRKEELLKFVGGEEVAETGATATMKMLSEEQRAEAQ